jgi:hypothetical protein
MSTSLSDVHLQQLVKGSGIAEAILAERGAYTTDSQAHLETLKFAPYQRLVPALVFPVYDVHGSLSLHQIRPDTPRKNKKRKLLKYETPEHGQLVLDILPSNRPYLQCQDIPLLVVEGLKKEDSILSRLSPDHPLCVLGVIGTWGWMRNRQPLPDWQQVTLKDRKVILVYDSDATTTPEVGKARSALAAFLAKQGAHVHHVDFAPLPTGKCGADDYLVQGHSLADMLALAHETFPQPRALLIPALDVQNEPLTYLWEPYIPTAMVTMLDGDPGVGKTGLACLLAACVTRGYPMPDQTGKPTLAPPGVGHVLMVAMEDHLGRVVTPRLEKCQADRSKITFLNERTDEKQEPRPFTLADLPLLTTYLERTRPRLVYIDAIQAVLGDKLDINRANAVTAILGPLKRLAEQYECAVLCSRHPAKSGQQVAKVLYRGLGSQAFAGTVRSGMFVEDHPDDETKFLLFHYKANADAQGRAQILSKARGHFEWCGITRLTHGMLAGDGNPGPLPMQRLKACLWLEHRLKDGVSLPATQLYKDADDQHNWSQKVVRAASEYLKVTKTQVAGDYLWYLSPLREKRERTGESGESGTSGVSGVSGVDLSNLEQTPLGRTECPADTQSTPSARDTQDTQYTPDPPVVTVQRGDSVPLHGICPPNGVNGVAYPGAVEAECIHEHVNDVGVCNDCGVAPQPWQCCMCQGTAYWFNAGAEPVCARCHPRPPTKGVSYETCC